MFLRKSFNYVPNKGTRVCFVSFILSIQACVSKKNGKQDLVYESRRGFIPVAGRRLTRLILLTQG
jgi:hypothetical protein